MAGGGGGGQACGDNQGKADGDSFDTFFILIPFRFRFVLSLDANSVSTRG